MSENRDGDDPSIVRRLAARMVHASATERVGIAIASTALALLIGVVIVAASGYDPIVFANEIIYGAVGTENRLASTLRYTTTFVATGVAVAVAFRAGVFNIGVQGQFVVGGFVSTITILGLADSFPEGTTGAFLLITTGSVAAIIAGGLYAALPGILKAYAGANEIITTIMLNFIATGVVFWLIDEFFRPGDSSFVRTDRFPDYVEFPQLYFDSPSFSVVALGIAIAMALVIYVFLERTAFGYDLVTSGHQEAAAFFAGVNEKRTIVATMTVSGMVAGLAGSVFVIMTLSYFSNPSGIPTYGFDAIAVSLLAANNPLGVIPAGLLFGGLESGGSYLGQNTDVPRQLIDGIIGLVVLFVATPELFRMGAKRAGIRGDER